MFETASHPAKSAFPVIPLTVRLADVADGAGEVVENKNRAEKGGILFLNNEEWGIK